MKTGIIVWRWTLAVLGAGMLAVSAADEKKADAVATTDNTEYNNWITLGVGSPFVSGNEAAFGQRQQRNKNVFGGVEDFHWEQNVGKKGAFELNGHGIYDENNYGADLKLSDPDIGYVKAGFEQFRTWYNGAGGYFPGGTSNNWLTIYDDTLAVDRGRAWFEAGLTMPDVPQITFRYEHEFRDGQKDSTIWGASTTGNGTRRIVPTFLDLNEKRDIFSLDVKHTIGKTSFDLGGTYQHLDNNNSRNIRNYPGQSTDRYATEREKLKEDLFSAHALSETRFTDKVKLSLGGSFTTLESDVNASRIFGTTGYDPVLSPIAGSTDRGFIDGTGGANVKLYVANLNLKLDPAKNLVIVPSFRIEKEYVDGLTSYTPTRGGATNANSPRLDNMVDRDYLLVTEALEARYTGFKNWSVYARAEWAQGCQDTAEIARTNGLPSSGIYDDRSVLSHLESFSQKYTAGANWYLHRGVNMGGQYYYKVTDYEWDNTLPSTTAGNYKRSFSTHDLNYRLTLRPASELSFVTRYDFQLSKANFQASSGPTEDSSKMISHIISQSINWTPVDRMFVQLNGSYAWDGAVRTSAANAFGVTNVLPNLENGYWTATAMVGYALDEVSDLTLQYNFYKSENYVNNYLWTQPFGTSAEEHGVTATLSRQMNKRTKVSLKYGYFTSDDETSGDHNNYSAHLIYATLQYRF
jgi:hypothetical protein